MPEKDSEEEHLKDAFNLAHTLDIRTRWIDLTPYLKELGVYRLAPLSQIPFSRPFRGLFIKKLMRFYERRTGENPFSTSIAGLKGKEFSSYISKGNAYYRMKHRLRMVLLYFYGELENRLIVGAANKSEYQIGYFVKHGCDDAADIMPLLNLYKTQVRDLAQYLDVPLRIIEKPPSPDIIPGVIDEEAIGLPYEKLDFILLALEKKLEMREIAEALDIDGERVQHVKNLVQKSEHMRKIYAPKNFQS
jgi:NAD+ synthase